MAQAVEFKYAPMFQVGKDDTEYYLLTKDYVSEGEFEGHKILKVQPEALTLLAKQAFHDANFMLRRSHNESVAKILHDPEASDNDKYVALSFLRNAETAAKGELPFCQDTGTAIIHGEKGQAVWTGFCDEEALSIFNRFKKSTLEEVEKIYKRLNVTFDSYAGESFYNDKMQPVLDLLTQKGLLVDDNGAKIVRLGDDMPPCLLVRSDGATLYATRDLAAAFYRKKTYNFNKCLYVVASQQNLHFKQWFKVLELAGEEWYKDLYHVAHGMVSLEEGSLSTRSGNVVYLDDVLNMAVSKSREIIKEKSEDLPNPDEVAEQIGVGAVIFGVLYNNRIKDMTFSYSRALNFDGETGPYVQYTQARCRSLLEKCAYPDCDPDYSGIAGEEAGEVLKLLDSYPDVILSAVEKYEPCYLSRFLVDLSQAFGKFYLACNIAKAPDAVRKARLMLVKAVQGVLVDGLSLLGIKAPEKM